MEAKIESKRKIWKNKKAVVKAIMEEAQKHKPWRKYGN